jgi:hypothetical protein
MNICEIFNEDYKGFQRILIRQNLTGSFMEDKEEEIYRFLGKINGKPATVIYNPWNINPWEIWIEGKYKKGSMVETVLSIT